MPGERIPAIDFSGEGIDVSGSSYAVARITALAARILTEHPDLDAMQLKAKIISLATPERGAFVKSGWIKEPSDLFRDQDLASIRVVAKETFTEFYGRFGRGVSTDAGLSLTKWMDCGSCPNLDSIGIPDYSTMQYRHQTRVSCFIGGQ